MKKVYFILPEGDIRTGSVFIAIEAFDVINQYIIDQGGAPYYDIKIAGRGLSRSVWNSTVRLKAGDISKLERPDLIIIPGLSEKNDYSGKKNRALVKWIIEQYNEGTELASMCTGSFLLAATGLLRDMECTTHWNAGKLFTAMYPDTRLCADKIITDCKGIYTAGGATSSLNLLLYLIEKYNGRQAAIYCAKMMQIDIDRNSQSAFVIFEGQKDHADAEIKKVQTFIEKNIEDKITVDLLAEKFLIPKRSLIRRFKKAAHSTPIEYIQRVKMEAAKRNLEINRKSINDIMYEVGYSDIKAFRTIFKKIAGLSPIEYRKKYNKDYAA